MNVPEPEHVFLDIDPMLFMQTVVDEQWAMLVNLDTAAEYGVPVPLAAGIAEVAHRQIYQAQARLDALVAEDTTWRPA